jgi:hypothetical protein
VLEVAISGRQDFWLQTLLQVEFQQVGQFVRSPVFDRYAFDAASRREVKRPKWVSFRLIDATEA